MVSRPRTTSRPLGVIAIAVLLLGSASFAQERPDDLGRRFEAVEDMLREFDRQIDLARDEDRDAAAEQLEEKRARLVERSRDLMNRRRRGGRVEGREPRERPMDVRRERESREREQQERMQREHRERMEREHQEMRRRGPGQHAPVHPLERELQELTLHQERLRLELQQSELHRNMAEQRLEPLNVAMEATETVEQHLEPEQAIEFLGSLVDDVQDPRVRMHLHRRLAELNLRLKRTEAAMRHLRALILSTDH